MYAHVSLDFNVMCVCVRACRVRVCKWISVWGGFLDMWLGGPSILTANTWPGRVCLFGLVPFRSCSVLCLRVALASAAYPCGICPRMLVLMPYVRARWC